MKTILPAVIVLSASGSISPAAGGAPEPPTATRPATVVADEPESTVGRRILVRVNRDTTLRGRVAHEDADILVLRTPGGSLENFSKARILEIVRLVDPDPDQRGIVYLAHGGVRRGVIISDDFDEVVLSIEGIRTVLPRADVLRVKLEPTFEQRYAALKASIQPNQTYRLLDLCRWLLREKHYELARIELKNLLAKQESVEARRLLTIVEAQLALPGPGSRRSAEAGSLNRFDGLPTQLVSRESVNLMRVYEIDFDRPPRLSIPPATIRAMIDGYSDSKLIPPSRDARDALFRTDPIDIVRLLFELRARELYGQIEVVTEPHGLNLFRRRVHNTWLINKCATSRCHGGPDAGRFFLHRNRHQTERVRYTNLLILERLELDPVRPLIDYDDPMASLIIQYGLPRNAARRPHPAVEGWKPVFGDPRGRLLRNTIAWIKAMMKPRPTYPVDYTPPGPGGDDTTEATDPPVVDETADGPGIEPVEPPERTDDPPDDG